MLVRFLSLAALITTLSGQPFGEARYSNEMILVRVNPGDTLWDLARKWLPYTRAWNVPDLAEAIARTNGLGQGPLPAKTLLSIPVRGPTAAYKAAPLSESTQTKGIYLPATLLGTAATSNLISSFAARGGNTLVFDVKEVDGRVNVPFHHPLALGIGSPRSDLIPDLARFIQYLHEKKLRAVARVACFADRTLFRARPEYRLREMNWLEVHEHDRICWVDPGNPNVTGYLLDLILALTRNWGIDEVQLDYIRFPNRPDPLLRMGPDRSREDLITQFVKDAHRITLASGKRLSLSVFGIVAWNTAGDVGLTGQNLARLAPHCEGLHLMLYPSHFAPGFAGFANPADHPQALVGAAIHLLRDLTTRNPVAASPWLQAFDLQVTRYDSTYIRQSMAAARESGTGWFFWNPVGQYDEVLRAMDP